MINDPAHNDRAHPDAVRTPVNIARALVIFAEVKADIDELAASLAADPGREIGFDFLREAADELDGRLG
jgi:hypothetical protein